MARQASGCGAPAAAGVALVNANLRYWPTVFPQVRRELLHWSRLAEAIPDPLSRAQARGKLLRERFNTEVAATLATLAPPAVRRETVTAIVAMEVMYDYLDGVTEQPVPDPLANGQALYGAFADALAPAAAPPPDRWRHHPAGGDGGYLAALAAACRAGLGALPAAAAVAPVALRTALRCGEAQTRTHATALLGTAQLAAWASAQPEHGELCWWEVAAGAAASVLVVHALIAEASRAATTARDAERIAGAYLTTCALTTLLDSLVDAEDDAARGGHAYLAYYRDETEAAERLAHLARTAVAAAAGLPRAAHHLVTVAGAVAYYLSDPAACEPRAHAVAAPAIAELQPLIGPALGIFAAWRGAKRVRRGGLRPRLAGAVAASVPTPRSVVQAQRLR